MKMTPIARGAAGLAMGLCVALAACGEKAADKSAGKADEKPASEAAQAQKKEGGLTLTPEEASRAGVQVQALQPETAPEVVSVTATIKANQDRWARVAPRVEGRIVRVMANLGDRVRRGQPLATLDSVALGEVHNALRQAQAAQRVADADYKRVSKLAAEEIVPQKEVFRARADLEKANAEVASAQDKLRLLGGGGSNTNSGFTVYAPLTGTIIEKKATVGELATPAEPLFAVADLSRVWIEANLTEDMLAKIGKGAPAVVTVAAYPGVRFPGRVTYVAGVLDKNSHTTPARIEVDNRDGRLKPEMFATAEIASGSMRTGQLSVPDTAIVLMQGQATVFVQDARGFEQRAVEPGEKIGGRTIIRSGVSAGEQVVTSGAYALKARVQKSQISAD